MAHDALKDFSQRDMTFRFVSNVDGTDFWEATHDLDPAETLFVISSKTFTTLETLTNARSAREWSLAGLGGDESAVAKHFVAVSTNATEVAKFGIDTANMFEFWDWVGGRYSYDSAIGLSLMVAIGHEQFAEMLAGFRCIDEHFRTAPFEQNLPVLLGLIGIWYDDFFGAETQAILPYSQYLDAVPRVPPAARHGERRQVGRPRRPTGHDADRPDRLGPARHQRPARVLPTDPPGHEAHPCRLHRVRARQPRGRRRTRTCSRPTCSRRPRRSRSAGRLRRASRTATSPATTRPTRSSSARLTPYTLGQLVATYEHKVFTQGTIWNINSFDQWGVELGKQLATAIIPELSGATSPTLGARQQHQRARSAGTAGSGASTMSEDPPAELATGWGPREPIDDSVLRRFVFNQADVLRAMACGSRRPARGRRRRRDGRQRRSRSVQQHGRAVASGDERRRPRPRSHHRLLRRRS